MTVLMRCLPNFKRNTSFILRIEILDTGTLSPEKLVSVLVRLQYASHHCGAIRRHYSIVTDDSGIVTANSGVA